jgi:ankyrin repeat protein
MVLFLISKGARVNARDADGVTPLMIASSKGYYDIVKILIKNKAKARIKDNKGLTALDYARNSGNLELIKFLEYVLNVIENK